MAAEIRGRSLLQQNNPAVGNAIAADPALQLALADYDNQFTIGGIDNAVAPKNSMLAYLEGVAVLEVRA